MSSEAPENPELPPGSQTAQPEVPAPLAPPTEAKLPTRKDTSLREFLSKIDDYAPIVS